MFSQETIEYLVIGFGGAALYFLMLATCICIHEAIKKRRMQKAVDEAENYITQSTMLNECDIDRIEYQLSKAKK